jgi:hypothetical protein
LAGEVRTLAEQWRLLDREIAKGLEDVRKGRIYGPFTAKEATRFLRAELKARALIGKRRHQPEKKNEIKNRSHVR